MKKKLWLLILAAVLLVAVFTVPIPLGQVRDGGTTQYGALTYKIVNWNRLYEDGLYSATRVYGFPDNFKSLDELWEMEQESLTYGFVAKVLESGESSILAEPLEGEWERSSADKISCSFSENKKMPQAGDYVRIVYDGQIMESYPAQIRAQSWEAVKDLRQIDYPGQWLDKETAEKWSDDYLPDVVITEIYADCFFAQAVIPMPYTYKFNGQLSEDWCVGDQVITTQKNVYCDNKNGRVEADLMSIDISTFEIQPGVAYKPVLYLYPEQEMPVAVKLTPNGGLTCTYPVYNNGWQVMAAPDGTLTDSRGQTYNYLYWEGDVLAQYDLSKGFCVAGEDTAAFLEEALEKLGLTRREANEFIVYWLPLMQENPYNIISFQTDAYTDAAPLQITPAPDTLIRVFMTWKASAVPVVIEPQTLDAPTRTGFTAIEWGGTQLP